MKKQIFETEEHWAGMLARLGAGLILLPHGAQKLLGMFGGYGFSGTMGFFTETMHLPWIVAFAVIMIEFFGALSMIFGFAGRIWPFLNIVLMLGIIATSHWEHGFFMNWFGNQAGEGFEFHLQMIALSSVVMIAGSGKFSVDAWLTKRAAEREIVHFSKAI